MSTFRTSGRNGRGLYLRRVYLGLCVFMCGCVFLFISSPATAQDWFRTGTGLGVSKPRVAVADFISRSSTTPPLAKLFSDVLRSDLDYSGILELASSSFNPTQLPGAPAELNYPAWNQPPLS